MSNFDLIDRYFSNELDKNELKEFNDRLANDPEFNQEFQEIKEIKYAVKIEARKELKSLFTDIEDSLTEELPTNNQTAMKRVLTVAASLILLISASYLLIGNGQPNPQDVFTEYYTTYNALNGQTRGEAMDNSSLSAQAYNAYETGNFALAVEKFESLLEVEKTAESYFYNGIANIEIGNYDAALKNLNTTLNNFSTYKDQSKWFISLTLLNIEKEEEALSTLVSLASKKGFYKSKSKQALESLGFDLSETAENGGTQTVNLDPDDVDAPDGSMLGKRQVQYGVVVDFKTNSLYRFHNEEPIDGLKEGDLVEFWILKRAKGKKGKGWAFILDKVI
ncbi:hypothetical protein [Roseivirga sp.]|uniref:hypothetical protein n=1 Tax=Roseivirga sp. TaxID=1964215 RepID=UPI003B8B61EB